VKHLLFAKKHTRAFLLTIVLFFALYSTIILTNSSANINSDNSLVLLAKQFSIGHLSLQPTMDMPLGDMSLFNGRFYLFYGPLTSIILMPFAVLFGKHFPQVALGIASMLISFYAIYSIGRSFKFSKQDALWLATFIVFSTVLFASAVIDITAYQVEVVGLPLVLLSIREYFSKKRPLLIGIFLGLAILTREILFLAIVFYVLEFIQKRLSLKQLFLLFMPVLVSLIILGGYNFVRFHSVLETGYKYDITLNSFPLSRNLKYGYMSLRHIPANLYSFFIMPPQPLLADTKGSFVLKFPYLKVDPWGLAIWYTSPLFFLLLFRFKRWQYTLSALATTLFIAAPIFVYFSIGFSQYGYRYALDFLPFLFLLLIPSLSPKLSKAAIFLIIIGVLFNCLFISSLWGVYPQLGINH
jgi:hypothetical protein